MVQILFVHRPLHWIFRVAIVCVAAAPSLAQAQNPVQTSAPGASTVQEKQSGKTPGPPASTTPQGGKAGTQGGDSKSSSADTKQSASGKTVRLGPLDPSVPPPKVFARPRIGLAMGGGGALGLTEVGVLKWFEENHIPVDVIAGTSMGCLVSSLYATGQTPEQLSHIVNDKVFASVFSFNGSFSARSYRRREESRELPNGVTIGLRHGVSFRNAVLVDQGLNAFLDREFLRYDDQSDFNTLPIPLRCISTDLNEAKPVTFARGSIPDAVRASLSIPGIFPPFEMNGHEYVDGVVLDNLPTSTVRNDEKADVVLAVSLPLAPVAKGDLDSILGVFGRAFSVATESIEVQDRKSADLIVMPDIRGLTVTSYKQSDELVKRGYEAAEKQRAALLKYAVSDGQWKAYLAHRQRLIRGPAAPVLRVRVTAPDAAITAAVQHLFAPLVNQPVDTTRIEAMLDQVRATGALDADYSVGYETARQYAAQADGDAPIPAGTVDVPVTTTSPNAAPPTPNSADNPKPGAATPKIPAASTGNQPKEPEVAARPGASGLAATQEANAQSMADIDARPIILVTVTRKKTGPPFLILGANIEAQTDAFTRATLEGLVLDQNFGGYGSELRSTFKLGYLTELGSEYFRPLNPLESTEKTVFAAPRFDFIREPFPNLRRQHRSGEPAIPALRCGSRRRPHQPAHPAIARRLRLLPASLDYDHRHRRPARLQRTIPTRKRALRLRQSRSRAGPAIRVPCRCPGRLPLRLGRVC